MSQKRLQLEDSKPFLDQEGCSSDDKRRKAPSFGNAMQAMQEVMKFRNLHKYVPTLEPLIRRIVREEVDLALGRHMNSMKWVSGEEIQSPDSKNLQLHFSDSISLPVFTGSRIEGDRCSTLKITLIDAVSGKVVSSGPTSSANVEIVVLEGDFDANEEENWTAEEFNNNLVREREGKKTLLTLDALLTLQEGIGLVGEILFTDNSSWTRSRKFRLGARVVDNYNGIRVREAKTESFVVRDHRGELYKKHHPPCLSDEVWRLEKISKDGAFHNRLSMEGVNNVKDFLTLLFLEPAKLRNILGTGMSSKMWEATVEHARTCVLDTRVYFYPHRSQEKSGVVFNVVGQVTGMLLECQYVSFDKLSETEKAEAQSLVILAFEQWEEVKSFDDEISLVDEYAPLSHICHSTNASLVAESSNTIDISNMDRFSFDYPQLNASTPDIMTSIYSIECSNSITEHGIHGIEAIDVGFDESTSFPNQAANSLICDPNSITRALSDEHLQYLDTGCSLQNASLGSQADEHSMVDGILYAHSATAVAIIKAHRRWIILFSVLRWFSILRIVARKSMV